jgi:DNA-binding winged helix-turn-helix (wHTH) protein/Flp pilus assembly protein TadD
MPRTFEFGDFRLDTDLPSLTRGSNVVDLAPKALEILSVLVANAGQIVRKDDLLRIVWPNTVVEEGNLAVYVSALRKALVKGGNGSCEIQTAPKRGYRFNALLRSVSSADVIEQEDSSALFQLAEHYLQQNTPGACRQASAIYRKCIDADSVNVKARVGLADSLLMRFSFGELGRHEGVRAALELLAEANTVHANRPEVLLSASRLHAVWDWDWERARGELQQGLELAADERTKWIAQSRHSVYLVRLGDLDRGLRQLRQVSLALPLQPAMWSLLAEAHFLARDFMGAASITAEALQLHPNCWYLHTITARALTMVGEYSEALRHLRLARLLCPELAIGLVPAVAYVHAAAGKRDRAVTLLARILKIPTGGHTSLISIAMVHSALGNKYEALGYLEAACAAHECYISFIKRDCWVDPLRTQARLHSVLAQTGISPDGPRRLARPIPAASFS